jgi:hypothetical protein
MGCLQLFVRPRRFQCIVLDAVGDLIELRREAFCFA